MICPGYKHASHEVKKLLCKGLCAECYHHKYRDEHQEQIVKLRKEYRGDAGYRQAAREYMRLYRKGGGKDGNKSTDSKNT